MPARITWDPKTFPPCPHWVQSGSNFSRGPKSMISAQTVTRFTCWPLVSRHPKCPGHSYIKWFRGALAVFLVKRALHLGSRTSNRAAETRSTKLPGGLLGLTIPATSPASTPWFPDPYSLHLRTRTIQGPDSMRRVPPEGYHPKAQLSPNCSYTCALVTT